MAGDCMDYTGERMVPEGADPCTFWEHIERYRFASAKVVGKRVLDIASGEGYGSCAMLRAGAKSVIGVDIDEEACRHAARKYGVDARVGGGEAIPVDTGSVDIVVSFETIEHIPCPGKFLKEVERVLAPGGVVIISTPDIVEYNSESSKSNPFHCSELSEEEFKKLIEGHFVGPVFYGQGPGRASWRSPMAAIAKRSPWGKVRGLRRIRGAVWRWTNDPKWNHVSDSDRSDPVQAILGDKRSRLMRELDWFSVRRLRETAGWRPVYWIAVAQKRS